MKFFIIILLSSFHHSSWVYRDDVSGTPEPSHLLCSLYSTLQSQQPRSDVPNTFSRVQETHFVTISMSGPSFSLPTFLYLTREDTLHAYGYDHCSPLLSEYEHLHYCISESTSPYNGTLYRLEERDNDTLSPKFKNL